MDDARIREFEEGLWTGDQKHFRDCIETDCLMVLPTAPFVFSGDQAIAAVADTPRWSDVKLSDLKISRPQDGLIVVAYEAKANGAGNAPYQAFCTTTYRRLAHEEWRVVQHQQTPQLKASV